jgi:UDP-perosamine 4-acetyltransferase
MGGFGMKTIIIGAGGHARSVYECLRQNRNLKVVAFIDNVPGDGSEKIMKIPVIGPHSIVPDLIEKEHVKGYAMGIGDNKIRAQRFKEFSLLGLTPINAIHPTAKIAYNVEIGTGVMIGINSTLNIHAKIGNNTIINTGTIVEHEDRIEENVHIAPGTSIAGRVTVKRNSFIGIGSVIKEYITIGKNVIIGAGSVVLEDIPDNAVAVGSPAKIIKINNREN